MRHPPWDRCNDRAGSRCSPGFSWPTAPCCWRSRCCSFSPHRTLAVSRPPSSDISLASSSGGAHYRAAAARDRPASPPGGHMRRGAPRAGRAPIPHAYAIAGSDRGLQRHARPSGARATRLREGGIGRPEEVAPNCARLHDEVCQVLTVVLSVRDPGARVGAPQPRDVPASRGSLFPDPHEGLQTRCGVEQTVDATPVCGGTPRLRLVCN